MEYYNTLGVAKTASDAEIKQAYRRLASQHHPDKGGDTAKFQEIQSAYATLSDPEKRAQYDNPAPQGFGGFNGFSGGGGFEDLFAHFGFGGDPFAQRRQQVQRNQTLNFQTHISLEDAFFGKELTVSINLPSGKEQIVEIKIPKGVADGTTLRLAEMGDDRIPNVPRGDIHLSVHVMQHASFQRQGDDLIKQLDVNAIDAILGKSVNVTTLNGKTLEINIAAGTQHGQMLSVPNYGMPNIRDERFVGRLLINVNIKIPTDLSETQKNILRTIYN